MLLRATELHTSYTVDVPFTLPDHPGSLIRGVLGRALRRTGCARLDAACKADCERLTACAYARLFDPLAPSSPPHRFLQNMVQAPPRLLPLLPPVGAIALKVGAELKLGVRVLGNLDADEEERLIGALEAIAALPLGTDAGKVAFKAVTRLGRRNQEVRLDDAPGAQGRLRVSFQTPAWLEHRKKLIEDLPFSRLFRAIHRRLTTACALYGELGADHEATFSRLDALAAQVTKVDARLQRQRWERLSEERGERHEMYGITGWVLFEGNVGSFVPLMRMAEVAHVGKATSFGLGRVQVVVEER